MGMIHVKTLLKKIGYEIGLPYMVAMAHPDIQMATQDISYVYTEEPTPSWSSDGGMSGEIGETYLQPVDFGTTPNSPPYIPVTKIPWLSFDFTLDAALNNLDFEKYTHIAMAPGYKLFPFLEKSEKPFMYRLLNGERLLFEFTDRSYYISIPKDTYYTNQPNAWSFNNGAFPYMFGKDNNGKYIRYPEVPYLGGATSSNTQTSFWEGSAAFPDSLRFSREVDGDSITTPPIFGNYVPPFKIPEEFNNFDTPGVGCQQTFLGGSNPDKIYDVEKQDVNIPLAKRYSNGNKIYDTSTISGVEQTISIPEKIVTTDSHPIETRQVRESGLRNLRWNPNYGNGWFYYDMNIVGIHPDEGVPLTLGDPMPGTWNLSYWYVEILDFNNEFIWVGGLTGGSNIDISYGALIPDRNAYEGTNQVTFVLPGTLSPPNNRTRYFQGSRINCGDEPFKGWTALDGDGLAAQEMKNNSLLTDFFEDNISPKSWSALPQLIADNWSGPYPFDWTSADLLAEIEYVLFRGSQRYNALGTIAKFSGYESYFSLIPQILDKWMKYCDAIRRIMMRNAVSTYSRNTPLPVMPYEVSNNVLMEILIREVWPNQYYGSQFPWNRVKYATKADADLLLNDVANPANFSASNFISGYTQPSTTDVTPYFTFEINHNGYPTPGMPAIPISQDDYGARINTYYAIKGVPSTEEQIRAGVSPILSGTYFNSSLNLSDDLGGGDPNDSTLPFYQDYGSLIGQNPGGVSQEELKQISKLKNGYSYQSKEPIKNVLFKADGSMFTEDSVCITPLAIQEFLADNIIYQGVYGQLASPLSSKPTNLNGVSVNGTYWISSDVIYTDSYLTTVVVYTTSDNGDVMVEVEHKILDKTLDESNSIAARTLEATTWSGTLQEFLGDIYQQINHLDYVPMQDYRFLLDEWPTPSGTIKMAAREELYYYVKNPNEDNQTEDITTPERLFKTPQDTPPPVPDDENTEGGSIFDSLPKFDKFYYINFRPKSNADKKFVSPEKCPVVPTIVLQNEYKETPSNFPINPAFNTPLSDDMLCFVSRETNAQGQRTNYNLDNVKEELAYYINSPAKANYPQVLEKKKRSGIIKFQFQYDSREQFALSFNNKYIYMWTSSVDELTVEDSLGIFNLMYSTKIKSNVYLHMYERQAGNIRESFSETQTITVDIGIKSVNIYMILPVLHIYNLGDSL